MDKDILVTFRHCYAPATTLAVGLGVSGDGADEELASAVIAHFREYLPSLRTIFPAEGAHKITMMLRPR